LRIGSVVGSNDVLLIGDEYTSRVIPFEDGTAL